MKTIKMVGTRRFEIELAQLSNSMYVVVYEVNGQTIASEPMQCFKTAASMFDIKLTELEGN